MLTKILCQLKPNYQNCNFCIRKINVEKNFFFNYSSLDKIKEKNCMIIKKNLNVIFID